MSDDERRPEQPHEFRRRVQDLMDRDQFQGIDYTACDYPTPAEIVEYDPGDTQVIVKRKDAY